MTASPHVAILEDMAGVSGRSLRALVVGDDARVRHALGGLLIAGGSIRVVEEAATGCDVYAAIERTCPDVVVIDLDRYDPESWFEVVAAVRSVCAACSVVAIGAASTLADRALTAGADAFLSKLESPDTLCGVVHEALRRRSDQGAGVHGQWKTR